MHSLIQRRVPFLTNPVNQWELEMRISSYSPIDPPIAIICKCRPFNFRANGDKAVASAAPSTSNTLPSQPSVPCGVMVWICFGSLLKLSMKRRVKGTLGSRVSAPYPRYSDGSEVLLGDPTDEGVCIFIRMVRSLSPMVLEGTHLLLFFVQRCDSLRGSPNTYRIRGI